MLMFYVLRLTLATPSSQLPLLTISPSSGMRVQWFLSERVKYRFIPLETFPSA